MHPSLPRGPPTPPRRSRWSWSARTPGCAGCATLRVPLQPASHTAGCMCQPALPVHVPVPPCPYVRSLCLHLCSCSADSSSHVCLSYRMKSEREKQISYINTCTRNQEAFFLFLLQPNEKPPLANPVHPSLMMLLLLLSHFSLVRLCATPSLGFSRQEHWSGLTFPSPVHKSEKWKWSLLAMSDSSRPHGLQPTRLFHPPDFPGKKIQYGEGCRCLPQWCC